MKKFLTLFAAAAMLLALPACSGDHQPSADASGSTHADAVVSTPADASVSTPDDASGTSSGETAQPVDYTAFLGNYSDTDTPEGPCYTVSILNADNDAGMLEFMISYVGVNASPLYQTETLQAAIEDDHTLNFEWMDSWGNLGTGTLVLNPDDTSAVSLLMTVTEEAEINRATLSTHDEYKTLTRR